MTHHHPLRRGLLVLALALPALPAAAEDDCDAPVKRWQTLEAVRQMAAAKGWQIERLKIDDGCYEIRGTDAQGRSFKAKLDPETLAVLKIKQDAHRRARSHDRSVEDATRQNRSPPPDGAAASSPSLTPGAAPRRQPD
jgi:hypothetical protein